MTSRWSEDDRTLALLVSLGLLNQAVLSGSRVLVSLNALALGGSTFTVGVLMGLFALLPMLLGISVGRFADRVGVMPPLKLGTLALALGAVLPALYPGLAMLYASAALVGVGSMIFQLTAQKATGGIGLPANRARNFSVLAMAHSVANFIGPLLTGVLIDLFGYRTASLVLTAFPLVALWVLARGHLRFRHSEAPAQAAKQGTAMDLLRMPKLRGVLAINVTFTMGWDLHTVFVPIYGDRIGLSASQIGIVLSTFAVATFVVRVLMPRLVRRFTEFQILTAALLVAGSLYAFLPMCPDTFTLSAVSFILGMALGSGQPMVLALLHTHAPPGRVGEAVGLRMTIVQAVAGLVPMAFGALGATVGLAPVCWVVAATLGGAGMLLRRR